MQRPYKLGHQVLCITAFNFERKSLIGYTEFTFHPLRPDFKRIKLNSKQNRIYRVLINDTWEASFSYNDPTLEICQDESKAKLRSLDVFEKAQTAALNSVNPDRGNGEVTIKLPAECQQLLAELQPIRINIEFSLEQPDGGLHFVVPNMEGSLAEIGAHLFSYKHENSSRLWFPCIDSYAEPCTWKLEYTVDLDMVAVSCGDLIEVTYTGDRRQKTYHYYISTPTAAPNIALAVGPFETVVDPHMHEVTHFCLPHLKTILKNTTHFIHESFEFFEELMSSRYPYSCYKQVFVDESYEDVQSFATMSIFSVSALHSARIIDQTLITRKYMALAVAQQFFGSFIAMQSWCDAWLVKGISGYLTQIFVKKTFGNNVYRHDIANYIKEVQEYETSCGGIVLDPSAKESNQFFSTQQPHSISPKYLEMYNLKALLVIRMLEIRIGTTLLLQVLNKLQALAYTASQQKFTSNSWTNMLLSTNSFLKIIFTVTGKEILPFIEQWVYQGGCARFVGNFVFNRKRNVVELEIKQDFTAKGAVKYVGPLEVTIQELDGSFNHTFNIEENKTKFEITCHSKSRRNKKKKIPLMTGEEVDMDLTAMDTDSPVLWLRLDPGMNLLRTIAWEQPDYMWQYQLKYERDVVAQSEAIHALKAFPTPSTRKALTDVLESEQCYYEVRIESSICLAKVANAMVASWAGPPAMLMIFKKMFGSHSCPSIVRQNNFSNFQHYFLIKAIPLSMALLRNVHNICPPEVVRFLLDLFKYNDNSKNKYSDNYYRSALVDALAATVTPAVTTVTITGQSVNADLASDTKLILEEITRCLNLEKLMPCYRNTVTVSCLRAIRTLQKFGHLPSDAGLFRSYADDGIFRDVRLVAVEALVDFIKTDVNVSELYWLLEVVERDSDRLIRYETARMLASNPPFKRGEESLLNTEALVNRLWKLMNVSLSQDSKIRCAVADFYFVLFGRYRPSCLHFPDNFMVFTAKEKPMINPAVVSEKMTDMFEDDEEDVQVIPTVVTQPPKLLPEEPVMLLEEPIVDVEGNPSETESPIAGSKRPASSPLTGPPPKMPAITEVKFHPETILRDDSNPFKLKIKEQTPPVEEPVPHSSLQSSSWRPDTLLRGTGGDSQSRLSEDSNSSPGDSSISKQGPPSVSVKSEGLTSFHGLFPSARVEPALETVSGPSVQPSPLPTQTTTTITDELDPNKHHRMKKKKKKNKHKHKHKHRQEKHARDRSKDKSVVRTDSFSVPSPMVPSVQSVTSMTSMSSLDNTRDSAPSSPDFEVI